MYTKVSKCAINIYIIFNVMLSGSTKEKDEGPLGQLVPPECGLECRDLRVTYLFKCQFKIAAR